MLARLDRRPRLGLRRRGRSKALIEPVGDGRVEQGGRIHGRDILQTSQQSRGWEQNRCSTQRWRHTATAITMITYGRPKGERQRGIVTRGIALSLRLRTSLPTCLASVDYRARPAQEVANGCAQDGR